MNKIRLFAGLLFFIFISIATGHTNAQVFNPVKWTYESKSMGDNVFELRFIASIEPHWHLYSQHIDPNGPVPTSFAFKESPDYKLLGETSEPEGTVVDDPVFGMRLKYFSNKAVFVQKVKLLTDKANIKGELEYMTCDDEKCLPPELVEFSFKLKADKKADAGKQAPTEPQAPVAIADNSSSGILTPVKWHSEVIDLGNGEYDLVAIAEIEPHWHLYATELPSDDGPVATSFEITGSDAFEPVGKVVEEGNKITEHDKTFDMELSYYENTVKLKQKIKLLKAPAQIKGIVFFMACDDNTCIPPEEVELTFSIDAGKTVAEAGEKNPEKAGEAGKKLSGSKNAKRGLLEIFFLSFLGGFAALLTPCVFPMIPMTVSFFTKQSKTRAEGIRNAIFYGVSIIAIYVVLGLLVSKIFGADALNALSTNVWFNLIFFLLLIVFAISFLGAFEITLPSSWVNKADRASDKGGLIGIFFMAFTLALVSFSCTGPIVGTLLVDAAVFGGQLGPAVGMFGFSLALALPFGLFAMFPGWMNSLPKSGGWLNTVKVVLGFLELGLAFKFLSNADLVVQAGILTREIFLAIWIAVSAALTIYLFGWIRLPHDSPVEKLSVGRVLLAIVSLWFTIYLIPGMWGAPLKMISGFPPPMFYSESPKGVGHKSAAVFTTGGSNHKDIPKGADPEHCPLNINCFHDYDEGLAYAKEVNKPVMLDFTGWACVNCRKMEEQVWADPRVLERLNNDFVLISLYVDEKTPLPEKDQYVSKTTGKKIKTIGNKWSEFQIKRYGTNAQPHYVIIDLDENQLIEPAAYDPDIDKFIDWLDRGKEKFDGGGK